MTARPVETFDLTVFLTVARTGSFGAAAAEIGLSTPSVSSRMTALERTMQSELFRRSTHGSSLTASGQRLVPYAERLLILLQEAHLAVRTEGSNRVVIGAPASLGAVIFPSVLSILSADSLGGHCRVGHSAELVGQILDGTVDAALILNQVVPASVATHHLCRSEILTVCRSSHQLARHEIVHVNDLASMPVVVYRWSPEAAALAEVFEHSGRREGRPVHLVGLPSTALQLVADEDYVAVVPEFALAAPLRKGDVAELPLALPGWSLEVQLAYRGDSADSPGVRSLLAASDEVLAVITRDDA